jgi:hypothetical protein
MIVIVVATFVESKAIIDIFSLEKFIVKDFEIYQNKEIFLIISGIGTIKSAIATTYIISLVKKENISNIYNIGIAGCKDTNIKKGSVFLINKIINKCENKSLYPDILLSHPLDECSISTFSNVVQKSQIIDINSTLVDMESSGFFIASLKFLDLHKISLIKIVSDHLLDSKNDKLCKEYILDLIGENISNIQDFILNYKIKDNTLLLDIEISYIKEIEQNYKLSFTTKQKVYQAIKYKKLKENKELCLSDIKEVFDRYII